MPQQIWSVCLQQAWTVPAHPQRLIFNGCRIFEGLAPVSRASEQQIRQWPSEAFHECEGRTFSQPDLRSGDWSSYLVAVTGELADAEEDVLWPNQVSSIWL